MSQLPDLLQCADVRNHILSALHEDIGAGDCTSLSLVDPAGLTTADILTRQPCTVSGATIAAECFRLRDSQMKITVGVADGNEAPTGASLLRVQGRAQAILEAERTALNYMQRMTGIATLTRQYVTIAKPHGVAILDTRKTTPGMRRFEKYAVLCGGGNNHRMGLYDRVLIKDNHRSLWHTGGQIRLADAIREARQRFPSLEVEIEVESIAELTDALDGAPDWILLDNMQPDMLRRCVETTRGRCKLEVSGGVNLSTLSSIVTTGVDAVSVGALTHSVPSVDLSLEIA